MNEILGRLFMTLTELESISSDFSELEIELTETQKQAFTELKIKLHEVISTF